MRGIGSILPGSVSTGITLAEQGIKLRTGLLHSTGCHWSPGIVTNHEIIAVIGALLVAHFFSNGFTTLFGNGVVMEPALPAHMQLSTTLLADIEARQRQRQL